MRIYYYSGSTLPSRAANAVHVMKMCEAWGRAGHHVTLFAKGSAAPDVYRFYGVNNCFKIKAAPNVKIPVFSGVVRLIYYALHSRRKPDLAYGRDAVALKFLGGQETVFEAHQFGRFDFRRIVVISKALREDMRAVYPNAEYLIAPDGANISGNIKQISLQGDFKIGYAGSLHAGKGLETIIALAKALPQESFHVFGGDEAQIESAEKLLNVFYHGHIAHSDIPSYLAACDILIAPYGAEARIRSGANIARWISPMKIFEYMAARRAMICSDLPVIKEVLNDENALLVPPDDIEAWVRAVHRLKEHKDLREGIAAHAYKDLIENYTWDQRAAKILAFCSS